MENSLKYQVRSREIIDLVAAMRANRLTLTSYFQRNLVWRDTHKRDFIDTILKGYPFPQIFLARGAINIDTMSAYQCVVDGQQRLSTILDFVNNKLDVGGRTFAELLPKEKEDFLKYEVPVIDFDLDAGDPRLREVFHRLNRTFYSLTAIEKIASSYSASEFMLVARVLSGEITTKYVPQEDFSDLDEELDPISNSGYAELDGDNLFRRDPDISDETWDWLISQADGPYTELVKHGRVFSEFEFDRKVPLMYVLNIMCTYLFGYYNRNDKVKKALEDRNAEFPERQELIKEINDTSEYVASLSLPAASMWWNKANFFTLMVELMRDASLRKQSAEVTAARLTAFAAKVPADYALAAREGTGRKSQRELRARFLREALNPTEQATLSPAS